MHHCMPGTSPARLTAHVYTRERHKAEVSVRASLRRMERFKKCRRVVAKVWV